MSINSCLTIKEIIRYPKTTLLLKCEALEYTKSFLLKTLNVWTSTLGGHKTGPFYTEKFKLRCHLDKRLMEVIENDYHEQNRMFQQDGILPIMNYSYKNFWMKRSLVGGLR